MPHTDMLALAQVHAADLTHFVQRLIQTPSLTGHEGEVARVVEHEMQRLGYDEVTTDRRRQRGRRGTRWSRRRR